MMEAPAEATAALTASTPTVKSAGLIPDTPNDMVVAVEKEPLPLSFNVEVGAYINAIRSSLDILATAMALYHPQS